MDTILDFLTDLREHNDREWFHANRERYDAYRREMEMVASSFIAEVAEIEPGAAALGLPDCTYRIYRDTRFSYDKTPYKTHLGIFVNPPLGKKSIRLGYYLHIEPGNRSMFCAGTIGLPSKVMKAIRRSIFDNIEEYRDIVEDPEFRRLLPHDSDEKLKTAPQGFDRNWEYIDYVRPKNFTTYNLLKDRDLKKKDFIKSLRPYIVQAKRYNDFINYTIDEMIADGIVSPYY